MPDFIRFYLFASLISILMFVASTIFMASTNTKEPQVKKVNITHSIKQPIILPTTFKSGRIIIDVKLKTENSQDDINKKAKALATLMISHPDIIEAKVIDILYKKHSIKN